MAWGYWTTYSTYAARHSSRENRQTVSPPTKRDRSLDRERERHIAHLESGSRTPGSTGLHRPYPPLNHAEAEKVAYERRLLLGDPDWSSRTVADRNTLPRKKTAEFERGSTSEGIYGKSGHSPATTPLDSSSRKSDDLFCPACAQHAQTNSRDSRVSFGSIASSSRGSRGSSSGRGGVPIPNRSRSRSHDDEDERSSCSRGPLVEPFSTSLPTPPPPPFSSQRDILQQHSALMDTINQKISILSSFKPKYHTMSGGEHNSYPHPHHRRSASNVRSEEGRGPSLDHSSSSLRDETRRRKSEGACKSSGVSRTSGRKSSRRSSGSRTPRAHSGSAGSRRSRESLGSSERKVNISSGNVSTVPRRRSSSERNDEEEARYGGDEASDGAEKVSPQRNESQHESIEKVIAAQVVAAVAAKASKSVDVHESNEAADDYGTVRRKTRRRSKEGRLSSTGDTDEPQPQQSLRSSQSQTPDDDETSLCHRHGSSRCKKTKQDEAPLTLTLKKSSLAKTLPLVPQTFHHFKHYDHREHPTSAGQQSDFVVLQSGEKTLACCRPRSASIGNHLSDVELADVDLHHPNSTLPHRRDSRSTSSRRHHTLDGYCQREIINASQSGGPRVVDQADVILSHDRRLASMTSFHSGGPSSRSLSSKSEKSSRSSQSPSVENLRHGCNASKCCKSRHAVR